MRLEEVEPPNLCADFPNKLDRLGPEQQRSARILVRALNPSANVVGSEWGRVPLGTILNTGAFDFEKAQAAPGWARELRGEHTPESEEYGIKSFVYRSRRLDACLLTDAEMARGVRAWRSLPDPFPRWRVAESEATT